MAGHEEFSKHIVAVLDALLAWAEDASAKAAPKSALGKALHYLRE